MPERGLRAGQRLIVAGKPPVAASAAGIFPLAGRNRFVKIADRPIESLAFEASVGQLADVHRIPTAAGVEIAVGVGDQFVHFLRPMRFVIGHDQRRAEVHVARLPFYQRLENRDRLGIAVLVLQVAAQLLLAPFVEDAGGIGDEQDFDGPAAACRPVQK